MAMNIFQIVKEFFSKNQCYKQREKEGTAIFGMCGGLVGGDKATDYLQYSCVDCKYYNFNLPKRRG